MVTRSRIVVLLLLALIFAIAAWSKLRNVKESDHDPQRIRIEEHPAFQKSPTGNG